MTLSTVTALIVFLGGVGEILFLVLYTVLSKGKWVTNPTGRNIVASNSTLGFIFSYSAYHYYILGAQSIVPNAMRDTNISVLAIAIVAVYQRTAQMVRAQLADRRKEKT